jgi:hypothetical protein
MANLYINVTEEITLTNNETQKVITPTIIPNINYVDVRNMNCPIGSQTTIFSLGATPGAGTFVTSSFQYGRISNNSTTVPVKLIVSSSTEAMSFLIATGSSFMLSTSKITGSTTGLLFNDIKSVKIEPSGSAASIEYYILTN